MKPWLAIGTAIALLAAAGPARSDAVELACATCAAPALVDDVDALAGLRTRVRLDVCVQVRRADGRDILVNRCKACRRVTLNRRRPGGAAPIDRTYTMPAKSHQTLSFRGPGRSRITSDIPCGRGPTLLNTCLSCRLVIVERLRPGSGKTSQTYTIGANRYIPVPLHGARDARIASDRKCP